LRKKENAAECQAVSAIVDDQRERARSYRVVRFALFHSPMRTDDVLK